MNRQWSALLIGALRRLTLVCATGVLRSMQRSYFIEFVEVVLSNEGSGMIALVIDTL